MVTPIDVFVPENNITPPLDMNPIEKEEMLAARYSRKNLFNKDLVFEFTRDKALLQQYYKIRENEFNAIWNLAHFSGAETEHDRTGHIMVIRMGNYCVGGVRINIKSPRKPVLLPIEADDFRLERHFPELYTKQMSYGQLSSLALLPEFRGDVTIEVIRRVFDKAIALNADVLFAACPMLNARLYKKDCVGIGFKGTQIHYDVALPIDPTSEGIRLYLMSSMLNKESSNTLKHGPIATGKINAPDYPEHPKMDNREEV